MDDIQKQSDEIKKQLEKLDDATLETIYKDHAKAVEYVKRGLQDVSIEALSNKSIEDIAYEMQTIAKIELNLRTKTEPAN